MMKPAKLAAAAALLLALPCAAGVQRTFVSAATGSDMNSCSRTAPCRNFSAAIAQTNPSGEIVVLDSGGYGPVIITQSISLEAPEGVIAGITAFSNAAITVGAGDFDTVIIRGVTINCLGGDGITTNSGLQLIVENSWIIGAFVNGITARISTVVKDSYVVRSGGSGIRFQGDGINLLTGTVEHCRIHGSGQGPLNSGVDAHNYANIAVRNSVFTNTRIGIAVDSTEPSTVSDVIVEKCLITGNSIGVLAGAQGAAHVSNSTITDNAYAVSVTTPGSIVSRGNNTVAGNLNATAFTGTFAAQ